ncbi:MAG: hypothetical protein PHN69_03575 [Candidatus Pacebacteria bacterium]|nr:hypothetical protein [Fermentimonas sp.]MDD4804230.1 hypothetical protein [Candidatus Paceibacterota bacterium]
MAPKKKKIPLEDLTILGLKTLKDEDWTHEAMANYYTEKLGEHYSRRTIERELKKLKEMNRNNGDAKS